MPMTVYLFGEGRGVPLNYLHVQLNPLAIDFWSGGSNRDLVVSGAADEAGGQAFATDFAGDGSLVGDLVYGWYDFRPETLRGLGAADFVAGLAEAGFIGSAEVLAVLQEFGPCPASIDETDFYNQPWSYDADYAAIDFDVDAAVDALIEREVQPREHAADLASGADTWLTRLRSSVSPEEMTTDPFFGFNVDLPEVDRSNVLRLKKMCDDTYGTDPDDVPQLLDYGVLEPFLIPSENVLRDKGISAFDYVESLVKGNALIIEQMYSTGPPEVVGEIVQVLPDESGIVPNDEARGGQAGGCGCSNSALPTGAVLWAMGLLAVSRRRRG
jgi:hypothetical protein